MKNELVSFFIHNLLLEKHITMMEIEKYKILLVDDEEDIVEFLGYNL